MTLKTHPLAAFSFMLDRRARIRIAAVTLLFTVVGVVIALAAPKWYRSVLVIVPATPPKAAGVSSLLGSELGGLAAGLGAIGGGGADGARIVAVLQSNAVTDGAIEKFDLLSRFGAQDRESARDEFWRRCEARALAKPNLVQVSCEDTDPRFVQELLSFLAERGNLLFRKVGRSSASEEVKFLEARADELRVQADETAARVREFQETHRLVDLDSQAKALVSEVAVLNSQRITKQMELDYARVYSSRDEATARQLESQLAVVDDKLADLEETRPPTSSEPGRSGASRGQKPGMFPPANAVPKLRSDYEKLLRDRKVVEATLVYVLQQLEGARASEARNVSTFQVLDPPVVPTRKSRPSRTFIVGMATLLGLATALAFEWWRAHGREKLALVLHARPGNQGQ